MRNPISSSPDFFGFGFGCTMITGFILIVVGSIVGTHDFQYSEENCVIDTCTISSTGYCKITADNTFTSCYSIEIKMYFYDQDNDEILSTTKDMDTDDLSSSEYLCNNTYKYGTIYKCYLYSIGDDIRADKTDTEGDIIFFIVMSTLFGVYCLMCIICGIIMLCTSLRYETCEGSTTTDESNSPNESNQSEQNNTDFIEINKIIHKKTTEKCLVGKEEIPDGARYLKCALMSDHIVLESNKGELTKCPYCKTDFKPCIFINEDKQEV